MATPTYTLPPLPYAYDVSTLTQSLLDHPSQSPSLLKPTFLGPRTGHLPADHGAAPPEAPPDLHHQPQRRPGRAGQGHPGQRRAAAYRPAAEDQVQRRRAHQPLAFLEEPDAAGHGGGVARRCRADAQAGHCHEVGVHGEVRRGLQGRPARYPG